MRRSVTTEPRLLIAISGVRRQSITSPTHRERIILMIMRRRSRNASRTQPAMTINSSHYGDAAGILTARAVLERFRLWRKIASDFDEDVVARSL